MSRKKPKLTKAIKKVESQVREAKEAASEGGEPRQGRESPEETCPVVPRHGGTTAGERNLKDLIKDIIASYDARVKVVGEIVEDTHKMLGEFKERREGMSKELREILAKSESLRKKDFDRMMADIVSRQNEREGEVRKMLEDFRKEEESVAEKLRNLLRKGEEIRIKDFKKMMFDIKQGQERKAKETGASIGEQFQKMQEEVHTMLDNFKKERQSVAGAWHEALSLFHKEKSEGK